MVCWTAHELGGLVQAVLPAADEDDRRGLLRQADLPTGSEKGSSPFQQSTPMLVSRYLLVSAAPFLRAVQARAWPHGAAKQPASAIPPLVQGCRGGASDAAAGAGDDCCLVHGPELFQNPADRAKELVPETGQRSVR